MFQTKGQFLNGERIYEVKQDSRVYNILQKNNCQEFKKIIICLLEVITVLKRAGIVHSDLKSENIMIKLDFRNRVV